MERAPFVTMTAPVQMHYPAPAKLNLFLHVTGRRPDGYHLLQTAFILLDWCDTLHFVCREDGQITRQPHIAEIPLEHDLCVRAAKLLQVHTGCRQGVDITLTKRLPTGGGLGGGSSDAATTLIALNQLWQTNLNAEALSVLGLKLGADVPFFIFGKSAFAEGIGEALQPLEIPPSWYVVIHPHVHIPTAEIFAAQDLTRNSKTIKITDFVTHPLRNDLTPVAVARYPEVGEAMGWLAQFSPARMTGSGACVFAPVASEAVADEILHACPAKWSAHKARGLAQHPLYHLSHPNE